MPNILISPDSIQGDYFLIEGDEAHHLLRVLRKKSGDEVDVTDGNGHAYHGVLLFVDPAIPQAKGRILSSKNNTSSRYLIRLYQGLPKGAKFDFILEKATELGVASIHPFLSEKNVIKISKDASAPKEKRWQKLVEAATKQSGRANVPKVQLMISFDQMLAGLKEGTTFLLDPRAPMGSLKKELKCRIDASVINLVVGPESGFSDQEVKLLEKTGVHSISMGDRILRTETAGLVALSIINYELELF